MSTPLEIVKQKRAEAVERIKQKTAKTAKRVFVGMATCEIAAGSRDAMAVFKQAIEKGELNDVFLSQKGCAGRCHLEPTVEILEDGKTPYKYGKVTAERAKEIIEKHLKNGEVIEEWLI